MLFLAREIEAQGRLTVITSAVNIVPILVRDHNVDVVQLGGMVRNASVSAVRGLCRKPDAARLLVQQTRPWAWTVSTSRYGLSTDQPDGGGPQPRHDPHRTENDRAGRQLRSSAAAGSSKICDLSDVDQIITDSNVSPHTLAQLRSQGIEVTVVEAV